MRQVAGNMGGGLEPTFKEGLPNIYSGVITIPLAFLYLTCRKVKVRDKVCSVLLLLFFMVSFIIRQLDYIWHGFHFTNMIPYRFSFLFSFVMLYMAYRAYLLRRYFKLWHIILASILTLGVFACSENILDPVFIAYNLIFFILYIAALLYPLLLKKQPKNASALRRKAYKNAQRWRRNVANIALAGIMTAELLLNVINFGLTFPYTGISNYPSGLEDTVSVIDYMERLETDTPFYRAETTHSQTTLLMWHTSPLLFLSLFALILCSFLFLSLCEVAKKIGFFHLFAHSVNKRVKSTTANNVRFHLFSGKLFSFSSA
jgi:hypothetical protein